MTYLSTSQPPWEPPRQPARGGMPWWGWLLLGLGVVVVLPCLGCFGWLFYVGSVGPNTSVYTGSQVPQRFINVMKDVGALEDGEQLRFFYSDAMTDIRGGFYFISDRKVVVYDEDTGNDPMTAVAFEDIADVGFYRDQSYFNDSTITLELTDGTYISFPVSSENNGDQQFYDAIQKQVDAQTGGGSTQ